MENPNVKQGDEGSPMYIGFVRDLVDKLSAAMGFEYELIPINGS